MNKLLVLFDVYDSWGNLGTMGVTSRAGVSANTAIYEKGDQNEILLSLPFKKFGSFNPPSEKGVQGFIQATLMSARQHKKSQSS